VAVLAGGLWVSWIDVHEAGFRLVELEEEINKQAEERLLQWENKWGGRHTRRLLRFLRLEDEGSARDC
jgi:hypothetical protein